MKIHMAHFRERSCSRTHCWKCWMLAMLDAGPGLFPCSTLWISQFTKVDQISPSHVRSEMSSNTFSQDYLGLINFSAIGMPRPCSRTYREGPDLEQCCPEICFFRCSWGSFCRQPFRKVMLQTLAGFLYEGKSLARLCTHGHLAPATITS